MEWKHRSVNMSPNTRHLIHVIYICLLLTEPGTQNKSKDILYIRPNTLLTFIQNNNLIAGKVDNSRFRTQIC